MTSQYGQGAELIVIAAVIIGGASILGGRGRVLGACLGAILVVLIDKVLREGMPITRTIKVGDAEMQVKAMASAAAGRGAGLPRPDPARGRADRALAHPPQAGPGRLWAWLRGSRRRPPRGRRHRDRGARRPRAATAAATALGANGLRKFLARRERGRDHPGGLLWLPASSCGRTTGARSTTASTCSCAFTEIALVAVGLTYVIANGDIDLSVGSVLALAGSTAAFLMKARLRPAAGRRSAASSPARSPAASTGC